MLQILFSKNKKTSGSLSFVLFLAFLLPGIILILLENISGIYFDFLNAQQVVFHEQQLSAKNLTFNRLLKLEPAFRQLLFLDPQKRELAKVSRISSFSSISSKNIDPHVFTIVQAGKPYAGSVYIENVSREPMILLAIPVKSVLGDLKGFLIAEVNLKFMWDVVSNIQIGQTGFAYVVYPHGDLLSFNDTERVLKGENLKYLQVVHDYINNK